MAQDLSRYRAYVLESSLASLIAASGARATDVRMPHERPVGPNHLTHIVPCREQHSRGAKGAPPVTLAPAFDLHAFLRSAGISPRTVRFAAGALLFAQGSQANSVFYVQEGRVKLSVLSSAGKEAVVALLGAGDFFGEGCLAGQPLRMGTARAVMRTALQRISKRDMVRMLHERQEFSDGSSRTC